MPFRYVDTAGTTHTISDTAQRLFYNGQLVRRVTHNGGIGTGGREIYLLQPLEFYYTGGVQSITLQKGRWRLECWGAQGGNATTGGYAAGYTEAGGEGGYASGEVTLANAQTVYICVGQKGANNDGFNGAISGAGYNGGGTTNSALTLYRDHISEVAYAAQGGGATHIATASGTLRNISSSSVYVVGAGGGGSVIRGDANGVVGRATGGKGGGETGEDGSTGGGSGGTQYSAGSCTTGATAGGFGYGANKSGGSLTEGAPGGGGGSGWYGGGTGHTQTSGKGRIMENNPSGAGGSCYVASSLASRTLTRGGRTGNGFARITFLGH